VLAGVCAALVLPPPAGATEFRKSQTAEVRQDETIKGDIYLSGERVRVEGTVDGDVYVAGKDIDIDGHVTGDVIGGCQSLRIRGQVDGNLRTAGNTGIITGSVGRNVTWFGDSVTVESTGKVGGTVSMFGGNLAIDGQVGRDILFFGHEVGVNGSILGSIWEKGDSLIIASTGQVGGRIQFTGNQQANVSPGAKLASPVEFTQREHRSEYTTGHYYIWRIIWTAAFILLGLVLFLLLPKFAAESVAAAERVAAPIGLGVLVFFGVPIAALLACVTVVGFPLGLLTLGLWFFAINCAELVVGNAVGNWIFGRTTDVWGQIGRMAAGFVIVRIVYTPIAPLHVIGFLVALGIWMWGIGAISLALYKRLQPKVSASSIGVPVAAAS
jgi:cytoskeletal protein CcmA (bactofilin family)